jgi:integrase
VSYAGFGPGSKCRASEVSVALSKGLPAEEIDAPYKALILAAGTGLRPGGWVALERRDLDLTSASPSVTFKRRLTKDKTLVDETKNGNHRRVPLRPKVVAALRDHQSRIETKLVFPAAKGGYIDLHN